MKKEKKKEFGHNKLIYSVNFNMGNGDRRTNRNLVGREHAPNQELWWALN